MKFTLLYFYSSDTAEEFVEILNYWGIWHNRSMTNGFHEFLLLKEDENFASHFIAIGECSVSNMKLEITT